MVWGFHPGNKPFFLSNRKLKIQIWGLDTYITGILQHKDHSWNVEWGNCFSLVYATPIACLSLLYTRDPNKVIPRHLSSWSSVCGPVLTRLCVFLMWQCTKGSCQSQEEVIFRQSGMVAEVPGSSGTAVAELSSTLSPASWGLSNKQWWLWFLLGFSAGLSAAGFTFQPSS